MGEVASATGVISPETKDIDSILAMRELARRNYADFLRYWLHATGSDFMWNWHWDYLADLMQAVALGDTSVRFLIVNIPPRFAKSTLLSRMWQAWMIGRVGGLEASVFSIAGTDVNAKKDSYATLSVIQQDWYKAVFPQVALSDKTAENNWITQCGAFRIACGAEGTVTGRGAFHLIWDDILKPQEADSDHTREKRNAWLGETLVSRLDNPKRGTITGIMQRLHEADPTGYLLAQSKIVGAHKYTHVCLPNEAPCRTVVQFRGRVYATRETGDLLHPARIGADETAALRISMGANYSGQYQQQPTKMEGGDLDPRKLLTLTGTPEDFVEKWGLQPSIYIDLAATTKATTKDDPDSSVIDVVAKDLFQRLVILDIWVKQTADFSEIARVLIAMHKKWNPRVVRIERGALYNVFMPILRQQGDLCGRYVPLQPIAGRKYDKVTRSKTFQGLLQSGCVATFGASWRTALEGQMRAFPRGAHDDIIDPLFDAAVDYPQLGSGNRAPRNVEAAPSDLFLQQQKQYKSALRAAIDKKKALLSGRREDDW